MITPDKNNAHRWQSSLKTVAAVFLAAVCCLCPACDEDDILPCCDRYPGPIDQDGNVYYIDTELDTTGASYAYHVMCETKTAAIDSCRFRKVDQYISAAWDCCAPILSDIRMNVQSFGSLLHDASPLNAYTWCLINTKPNDYSCDTAKAIKLEKQAKQCCAKSKYMDYCVSKFLDTDGKTCQLEPPSASCCKGLPTRETDTQITQSDCEYYTYMYDVCINTPEAKCCVDVPETGVSGAITKKVCTNIYKSTKQCVNTDYLYDQFKRDCTYGTSENKEYCP